METPVALKPRAPVANTGGAGIWQRISSMVRAGLAFAGRRDYYQTYGYPRQLSAALLMGKYQRQDITSRIVNMPPEEMWKAKPKPKDEGLNAKWNAFAARTELWDRIIQADKLCYFGPFAVLLLGMRGNSQTPAGTISSLDDILYLQAYGGDSVTVKEYEDDQNNPRFGQPRTYEVSVGPSEQNTGLFNATKKVFHWTRVIHIVDRPLQGTMFAEPRLNQIYNLLDDLLKIGGGSAELFWNQSNRGMQIDVDKEMELDADAEAGLTQELDEYQHNLRRYIRTRGVKIENLGSDPVDPSGVFEVAISLLAGATSIPQRILMGSEAGQLASEQDRANWAEYMGRRRAGFGEPYVLRVIVKRLGELGYLPKDTWEKMEWVWPEAFPMNPLEKANAIASVGRAVVNMSRRVQFDDPIISDEEAREACGFPAKMPAGHTMPKMPEKPEAAAPGGGSKPGGDSDAANAITQDPGTKENVSALATRAATAAIHAAVRADRQERPITSIKRSFVARRNPANGDIEGEVIDTPVRAPASAPTTDQ
jgi:hypothetical protein